MIENIVKEKAFYFSYQLDLSKNIQATIKESLEASTKMGENSVIANLAMKYPNSMNYIPQFIFNNYLLKDFEDWKFAPFKVPCIFGYLYIKTLQVDALKKFDFALISKKDVRRPGRRFLVRGIDREGNVANFVETEHVLTLYE